MKEKLKSLLQERKRIWQGNEDLIKKREAEGRKAFTADEQQEWDKRDADFEAITRQIEEIEKLEERRAILVREEESRGVAAGAPDAVSLPAEPNLPSDAEERVEVVRQRDNEELRSIILGHWNGLSPMQSLSEEQRKRVASRRVRAEMRKKFATASEIREAEARALSHVTNTAGEYLIPESWFSRVTVALKQFGGMRQSRATILRTSTGEQFHLPTVDDTSNTARLLPENTEVTETDITLGEKVLDAYLYHSDLIRFPVQLAQDSAFDVGGLLARLLGERIGRKTNAAYTTGSGSSQPQGIVGASAAGKTAASATAIDYYEMLDLKYSVDPAYAVVGEWMFHNSTLKAIKQLADGESRPLFQPDVQSGRVDRIDGDPFIINNDMAEIATTNKVMLYGDFSYFYIRDVLDVQMLTLRERYAEYLQIGMMAYLRTDSEEADAGQSPVKHYVMA